MENVQTLWILALAIGTPLGAVVGFALQLRQVKKVRLENEKLQLELIELREAAKARDHRIMAVSTEEVVRYSQSEPPALSRQRYGVNPGPEDYGLTATSGWVGRVLGWSLIVLLVGYLLYDLYRAGAWIVSFFY